MVIVNPCSGGGATAPRWPGMAAKLEAAIGTFEVRQTEGPGHATVLAREGLVEGATRVIAVGGDGTASQVVSGFFENGELVREDAVFGLINSGTGGDFRHNLGIGPTLDEQIETIRRNHTRPVSLGHVRYVGWQGDQQERYFTVICAFGISSAVNRAVNDAPRLKRLGGGLAFAVCAVKTVFSYRNLKARLVYGGNEPVEGEMLLLAACNGPRCGGGMRLAPEASVDSDTLDVVVAGNLGILECLRAIPRIYRGTHLNLPKVSLTRDTCVEALPGDGGGEIIIDTDGDPIGHLPATIRAVPQAIMVLAP